MSSSRRLRDGREPTLVENVQDIPGMIAELKIQASSIVSVHVSRATGPTVHLDWSEVCQLAHRMGVVLAIDIDGDWMHGSLMIDGVEFLSVRKRESSNESAV